MREAVGEACPAMDLREKLGDAQAAGLPENPMKAVSCLLKASAFAGMRFSRRPWRSGENDCWG